MTNPSRLRYSLPVALIVAVLAVSTASILIRFAQRDASSLTIAALRLVLASVALTPTAVSRHRQELIAMPKGDLALAALSGLFLAVHFATWISSLAYTTVASSVVLVSTGPIWVALLSPLLLKERLSGAALFGLGLAILGGIIIGGADACSWSNGISCAGIAQLLRRRAMLGNLLALIGAWAVSGYLIIGRRLRQNLALIPYVYTVYSFAGLALLIALFASGGTVIGLPAMAYVWIILLALVPQLIGHSTYNWALKALPAALVAVMTLGEPIGSAILAYFVLGEAPGLEVVVGGVLILAGIYLAARGAQVGTSGLPREVGSQSTDA